jgi:hypothetical protein
MTQPTPLNDSGRLNGEAIALRSIIGILNWAYPTTALRELRRSSLIFPWYRNMDRYQADGALESIRDHFVS